MVASWAFGKEWAFGSDITLFDRFRQVVHDTVIINVSQTPSERVFLRQRWVQKVFSLDSTQLQGVHAVHKSSQVKIKFTTIIGLNQVALFNT